MLNAFDDHLEANNITDLTESEIIKLDFINQLPGYAGWVVKLFMMILPLICILAGFILYQKKFKIDEKFYEQIVTDLEERNSVK